MVETAKGEVMKLSTHTILRLFAGTVVLLAVAAIAAPTAAAKGALDPWQQNLIARQKYAQMTDPWALNLLARQAHRNDAYTASGSSAAGKGDGGRPAGAGPPEITAGFAASGSINTGAHQGTTPVEVGGPNGFDWSDAGIGAVSAFGIVLLIAGTAIVLRKSGALAHMHL
jgi:hypothetical protein